MCFHYGINTAEITHHSNIAKLVSTCHSIVVQHSGTGDPARVCVVSKYNKLVFLPLVAYKVETVLNITHNHSLTHCMNSSDKVWNVLNKIKNRKKQISYRIRINLLLIQFLWKITSTQHGEKHYIVLIIIMNISDIK